MVAAGAGEQGEERGEQAVARRRAHPFNLAESDRLDGSVLLVSEAKGDEARRMAVEEGSGQPAALNVPAAVMKSILPEEGGKEEGTSRRERAEVGAAESGGSRVCTRGQGRTGKGGKGQTGASGARHATGHKEGKGGKGGGQGQQWLQPPRSFKQPPPGSPPPVSAAVRAEEEGEARRRQTPRYEVPAHMERRCRRHQAPEPGPDTIYRLVMRSGRGRSGRQSGQEGSGGVHSGLPSGRPQRGEAQAGQSSAAEMGRKGQRQGGQEIENQRSGQAGSAVQGRDAGLEEGGKTRLSGHSAQGKEEGQDELQGRGHGKAGRQGAGSKGHRKAGRVGKGHRKAVGREYMGSPVFPGKALGWWGGVVPHAIPPVIPPFPPPPYPAMGMVYPTPPAYPGMPSQAHVQQCPQLGGTTWGARGGRGEEHKRTWERIGEEERRLRESRARVIGGADRVAEG